MTKHTILFLAANPSGLDRLALDREARAIHEELKRSGYRDRFVFETRWAVRPLDLLRELRELRPTVVHFSGHSHQDGLCFQTMEGRIQFVSAAAIAEAFDAAGASVKLVVLSACYSEAQADTLLAHVDHVVGIGGSIHEDAARIFAIGFYGGLGEHESIAVAYKQGQAAIDLQGLPAGNRPQLKVRNGIDATRLILAAVAPPEPEEVPPCPYPGMRPYSADTAAHFHGRGAEVEGLIGRLRARERELYVIGPSGSGKSSLVAAGVLPRLAHGVSGLGPFVVRSMRPGEEPAARLGEVLEATGERTPEEAIAALLAHRTPDASVLLVIDQLEELFTLASDHERAKFLDALRALRAEPRCVLVLVLRADFYGALMDSPLWAELHGRILRVDVAPLRGPALHAAIERPACDLGVSFEPGLVERLVADAASEPGVLPLLQETLNQLWDRQRQRRLTLADYEALGEGGRSGLAVAISHWADATLRRMTAPQSTIARRILLRLVSFGEGRSDTRRQQSLSALRDGDHEVGDCDEVVQQLVDHRLLTIDDGRVDLAHEVLIAAWPTLVGWIQTHRADEQRRRQLEAAAAQWRARARGSLDPIELVEAEAWQRTEAARELGQSAEVAALVAESREAHDRQRRRRRALVGSAFATLTAFAVVVAILAVMARHQAGAAEKSRRRAEAERTRAEASDRESQRMLAQSYLEAGWQQFLGGHPQEALPYLLAARQKGEDGETLRMLIGAATHLLPLIPILEHHAEVSSAAFSPDGTRIVTASVDHTARIWDAATGKPLGAPFQHQGTVHTAAFSPDGTRIVTASFDGTARVWDAATGKPLATPLQHEGPVWKAAFNPQGTRVVTASDDHTARIWDAATGKPVTASLQHRDIVWSAAFSPDGTRVVTASWDKSAQIWDAVTGRPVTGPLEHGDKVWTVAFSPDGTRVLTASWDRTARVWDAATGKPVTAPLEHRAIVRSAAFSPDGTRVVTGSNDKTARVWDAATGKLLGTPFDHRGYVRTVAFSPDGTHVVTGSYDKTARVWEVATGKPLGTPLEHQGGVNSATFSPDGTRIVTASIDHTARVWDTATGKPLATPLQHRGPVNSATASLDGTRIVTASDDHTARIWDAATGEALTVPLQHRRSVLVAAFSPDGTRAVTASSDRTAQVWDAASGRPLGPSLVHQGAVNRAAFSPDDTRIVTASSDHTARIWDAATGRLLVPSLEHRGPVWSVAFSPDGTRIVTASDDETARVWNAATGEPIAPPLEHQGSVRSAAFSSDGARIVTASLDDTARIWDAVTGKPLAPPLEHQAWVESAAFNPDATRVVTASYDNTARVWDAATGQPLSTPLQHHGAVNGAAFSPDGIRVVTASDDHTARVWDAASGKPLGPALQHEAAVNGVAFSPGSAHIITASDDHTARLWEIQRDKTAEPGWSALAARSPFVLSGSVHVRRVHRPTPAPRTLPKPLAKPAFSPGASPDRPAEPIPFAPRQIWSGHYLCAQGRTSLALQIISVRGSTVTAVLAFSHAESGASGRHQTSGPYDSRSRRLTLWPEAWIRQPPGYMMVGMSGTVSADGSRFEGSILNRACSTFAVRPR